MKRDYDVEDSGFAPLPPSKTLVQENEHIPSLYDMPYYKRRRYGRYSGYRRAMRRGMLKALFPNGYGVQYIGANDKTREAFGESYRKANDAQRAERKRLQYYGRGAYSVGQFIKDAGALGEGVKRTYNAWIPKSMRDQAISMGLGAMKRFAGSGLYTGRGAYANNLVENGETSMTAGSPGDETETLILENREYIQDVYGPGSTAFTNNSLQLNPGLVQNFPWLSQIAMNYEEYDFDKLVFTYRSTIDIGNANTTGQSGSIIMVCDYNASHQPFDTKEAMMQYHGAISGKATDDLVCGIECDPAKTNMNEGFVRTGPVPVGEDIKTYDHGLFQFALVNIPTAMQNQQLGELWVEYRCRMRKPKLASSRGFGIQQDVFVAAQSAWNGTLATPAADADGPSKSIPLGTLGKVLNARANNLGTQISYPAANQILITFPASYNGLVKITYSCASYLVGTGTSGNIAITFTGQAAAYADLYGAPGATYATGASSRSYTVSNYGITADFDASIKAATGGVNNTVLLDFTGITQTLGAAGAGYWRSAQLMITEMNPTFSVTGGAPQLVNSAGTVTAPNFY